MGKRKHKPSPSWHQKKLRQAAVFIVTLALAAFAGIFYLISRL
jgi:hypothetical protein